MDVAFKQNLGEVVRFHREANGLTKQQLSLMVDVNRLTLRRIEQGTANPTLDVLLRISDGLDVSFPDLVLEAARIGSLPATSKGKSNREYGYLGV